jgi:hypothetical protein
MCDLKIEGIQNRKKKELLKPGAFKLKTCKKETEKILKTS